MFNLKPTPRTPDKRYAAHCKPVRVVAINPARVERLRKILGEVRPLEVGQVFESAFDASRHLGYRINALSSAFCDARRIQERMLLEYRTTAKTTKALRATIRGVTFEFAPEEAV